MKQVARYSRFLFSIIFRRWSYYVSTFVYLIVLAAVLFLVSAITKKPVSITLMYYGFNMMVVLAGAIVASIYSVQLFRAGIDDGTELLITAKPINRKEMLIGKCIVLLTLILMLSVLSMSLGFLTYYTIGGTQVYTYVGGGVFLTTLLILLFFSGVALVFCLITKKMGATLATIGTCFLFMIYCFIDTILSTAPSEYTTKNNIGLTPCYLVESIDDDDKNVSFNSTLGAVANSKVTGNAVIQYKNSDDQYVMANNLFLNDLWQRALLGTSRYAMMAVDPIFQWGELLNLQNYLLNDYQLGSFYQYVFENNWISNANLSFSKDPIDLSNYQNFSFNVPVHLDKIIPPSFIDKPIDDSLTGSTEVPMNYLLIQNKEFGANYKSTPWKLSNAFKKYLSKTIYIPEFDPLNCSFNNSSKIEFNTFDLSNNSWENIHGLLFNKNNSSNQSIVDKYANDFKILVNENLISNMKPLNIISCIQTFLNNGFIEMLNNPTYFDEFQTVCNNSFFATLKLKNISNLTELWKMITNTPKDFFNELLFINCLSLNTLKQIQLSAFYYLQKNINDGTFNVNDPLFVDGLKLLGVNSIIPTLNYSYTMFLAPYQILEGFTKLIKQPATKSINDNEIIHNLIRAVEACLIKYDTPPIYLMNKINLRTFTEVSIVPYVSLGGILGVWFSITLILLVVGTILYSRKDFI